MNPPNWSNAEDLLFKECVNALNAFSAEHSDVECCHFAFDSDPFYGYVLLCFDATMHSIQTAQAREQSAIDRRQRMLSQPDSWKNAQHYLNHPTVLPFCDNTGDFEFQFFREVKFPEWQEYFESDGYPAQEEHCDDYLEGNVRILLWKTTEKLIATDSFRCLKKASPFLISYGFHDSEQSVIRVINWPNPPNV